MKFNRRNGRSDKRHLAAVLAASIRPRNIFLRSRANSVLIPIFSRRTSTPGQISPDFPLPLYLYLIRSVVHWIFCKMQRALTSRASTLGRSSTSKLRPIASAGFNAQQLRFAHKVRNGWTILTSDDNFGRKRWEMEANKYGMMVGAQVWCWRSSSSLGRRWDFGKGGRYNFGTKRTECFDWVKLWISQDYQGSVRIPYSWWL